MSAAEDALNLRMIEPEQQFPTGIAERCVTRLQGELREDRWPIRRVGWSFSNGVRPLFLNFSFNGIPTIDATWSRYLCVGIRTARLAWLMRGVGFDSARGIIQFAPAKDEQNLRIVRGWVAQLNGLRGMADELAIKDPLREARFAFLGSRTSRNVWLLERH